MASIAARRIRFRCATATAAGSRPARCLRRVAAKEFGTAAQYPRGGDTCSGESKWRKIRLFYQVEDGCNCKFILVVYSPILVSHDERGGKTATLESEFLGHLTGPRSVKIIG